jgi:hypothetical protein
MAQKSLAFMPQPVGCCQCGKVLTEAQETYKTISPPIRTDRFYCPACWKVTRREDLQPLEPPCPISAD